MEILKFVLQYVKQRMEQEWAAYSFDYPIVKERSSCSKVFCKKGVLRIPLMVASERVNANEAAPQCSVAVGKENISGEA